MKIFKKRQKNDIVIKDFEDVTVPTSWKEVTLGQFQDLMRLTGGDTQNTNIVTLLCVMTGKDEAYINSLPAEFVEALMANLIFINEEPKESKINSNKIKINKEEYFINFKEKLTFGEYVTVNELIKNDPFCYSSVLAVLCRKQGEVFNDEFENNEYEQRQKLFESQPITSILPLIGFFLTLYLTSKANSEGYLKQLSQIISQLPKQNKI